MSEIKPPFKCSECDFSSSYQCHVDSHLESVHEGKKHLCPYCDAIYSRKNTLKDHIKSFHRSISQDLSNGVKNEIDNKICLTKPFQCLNCSESFVSKYDLNLHEGFGSERIVPTKFESHRHACITIEYLITIQKEIYLPLASFDQ